MGVVGVKIRKRMPQMAVADFTMSASYATNGDTLPWVGLATQPDCILSGGGDTGYVLSVDHANGKVKAWRQSAATGALQEVPNTTDLSAVVVRGLVIDGAPSA